MSAAPMHLLYLVASVLFVLGFKGLARPRTALGGNVLGMIGMGIAVVATLATASIANWNVLAVALAIGGFIGLWLASHISAASLPQLVALFNGLGGGASTLVVTVASWGGGETELRLSGVAVVTALIGMVTFVGSLVAMSKLQGWLADSPISNLTRRLALLIVGGATLVISVQLAMTSGSALLFAVLLLLATLLGLVLVVPIGGGDMPVVVAFLNAGSGLAAAATGFVFMNQALITAGALVGASGLILTLSMCTAMHRALPHVLFGGHEPTPSDGSGHADFYAGRVRSCSPEEVAMLLDSARRVVVVPGYGMAVAQAQYAVAELAGKLAARGVEVAFGIHPVAGRMPGHMNVLLAEADVPYESLMDIDRVNPDFPQTDVVLVVGASDIVNLSARDDRDSPIAGMPILNVDQARAVVVLKRSLRPGFAGLPNPLFCEDNTMMLFGDAKEKLLDLAASLGGA